MGATAFMVDEDNHLTPLSRTDYDSEDLFQTLLADHPAILGVACGDDGRLLLVKRETPVPDSVSGALRWSLDHLFLDRQGVPVLVEVKRSSDTRIRREVVGQMLDYAANGVAYWPIELIVQSVTGAATGDEDPNAKLNEFLGGAEPESFWRQVESNLRAGRIRMVFVADRIPGELRRIIEFLNEQMRPAEVLAIEVEQFTTAGGIRMLTPRVVGATERAKTAKAVQPAKPGMSEDEWLAELALKKGGAAAAMARKSLTWFRDHDFTVGMTDSQDAMYARLTRPDGKPTWPFFVRRSSGKLETSLQYLKDNPAFASESIRLHLLDRLKALPGISITTPKSTGWPAIPLEALDRSEVWESFVKVVEEIIALNAAGPASATEG